MKLKKLIMGAVSFSIAACMTFGFAACNPEEPDPTPPGPVGDDPVPKVEISIGDTAVTTVMTGDSVNLTATVTGAEDTSYFWQYDAAQVLFTGNTMVVVSNSTSYGSITVTAVANADNTVTATKTFTYKPATVAGKVGDLTSEMIEEIGNSQIKAEGTLKDVYTVLPDETTSRSYDFSVTMEDGAWSGSWNIQGSKTVMTDIYCRGDAEATNSYGVSGRVLQRVYIDKNNTVAHKTVKDNASVPAVWEAQHMWNHLSQLNVNTFEYDIKNDVYYHYVDVESEEDLFLMTYLSYSLTPMLEDTLDYISLKVEDGHITKLYAQTETRYYPEDAEPEDVESLSYSELEITFSEVGTATVAEPEPFEEPEYADKLKTALESMGNATNYTYRAVDTTTYSPEIDPDDYTVETSSYAAPASTYRVSNNTSALGTVGSVGKVTNDAILIATTSKYSSSMDGKDYRTEYTGYRQFEGYYEEFAYDASLNEKAGALYGKKYVKGNIFDMMPTFDFSANIFKLDSTRRNEMGLMTYSFVLRETAVTRDVAMEVSSYRYASDATASTSNTLTIVVDENGTLISTTYPYSLVQGTYTGYVNTTYSNIGTTTLDDDLFDGYVEREVTEEWNQVQINYRPSHSVNVPDNLVSGDVVINAFFGDYASYVPKLKLFIDIFGDNLSMPKHWADWKENGTDADGNTKYIDFIEFNAQCMDYDENMRLNDWDGIADKIDAAMLADGFKVSAANTDRNGTRSSSKNRYLTYTKTDDDGNGIMVVFENIGTSYFYISIYNNGDWQLSTRA